VTERGQLVALLMPIGHATLLDALQAAGD